MQPESEKEQSIHLEKLSAIQTPEGTPFDEKVALVKADKHLDVGFIPNTMHSLSSVDNYLTTELRTDDLDSILKHLWLAGLPAFKILPLHRQRVVNRDIVVCEQIGLHMVLFRNSIFVKPIPHALLHYKFFCDYIAGKPKFTPWALGFLSSYLSMIIHESDFTIAKQLGLLPSYITWSDWLSFITQLSAALTDSDQRRVCFENRYSFGELRLSRLNLIMQFIRFRLTRGYIWLDTQYSEYFSRYFALIILVFAAYFSVALSAFQVVTGAGTSLGAPQEFFVAAYWFSAVTLLVLAATVVVPCIWLCILLMIQYYYIKTAQPGAYERRKHCFIPTISFCANTPILQISWCYSLQN